MPTTTKQQPNDAASASPAAAALLFGAASGRDIAPSVRGLYWRAIAWAAAQANRHLSTDTHSSSSARDNVACYTQAVGTLSMALKRISGADIAGNADDTLAPAFVEELAAAMQQIAAPRRKPREKPADLHNYHVDREDAGDEYDGDDVDAHGGGDDLQDDADADDGEDMWMNEAEAAQFIHSGLRDRHPEEPVKWPLRTRRYFGIRLPSDPPLEMTWHPGVQDEWNALQEKSAQTEVRMTAANHG